MGLVSMNFGDDNTSADDGMLWSPSLVETCGEQNDSSEHSKTCSCESWGTHQVRRSLVLRLDQEQREQREEAGRNMVKSTNLITRPVLRHLGSDVLLPRTEDMSKTDGELSIRLRPHTSIYSTPKCFSCEPGTVAKTPQIYYPSFSNDISSSCDECEQRRMRGSIAWMGSVEAILNRGRRSSNDTDAFVLQAPDQAKKESFLFEAALHDDDEDEEEERTALAAAMRRIQLQPKVNKSHSDLQNGPAKVEVPTRMPKGQPSVVDFVLSGTRTSTETPDLPQDNVDILRHPFIDPFSFNSIVSKDSTIESMESSLPLFPMMTPELERPRKALTARPRSSHESEEKMEITWTANDPNGESFWDDLPHLPSNI